MDIHLTYCKVILTLMSTVCAFVHDYSIRNGSAKIKKKVYVYLIVFLSSSLFMRTLP